MTPTARYIRLSPAHLLWLVPVLALLALGCRSPHSQISDSMAAVMVENRPREVIVAATRNVFREHAYQTLRDGPDEYVFEKPGTAMNTAVYGDLSGEQVWVRVKVNVQELNPNQTLVECDAYIIRGHSNSFFEEEQKLPKFSGGPYQELLDQIKGRLR